MKSSLELIEELKLLADPAYLESLSRFGISLTNTLGLSVYTLREVAKRAAPDHQVALELWASGIHEARMLACMLDDPAWVTEAQMEAWVKDVDSWDVCDGMCGLFGGTPFAYAKAFEWSERPEEFVKRAGFVLMADLAYYDKTASDEKLAAFFPVIVREATDGRNFVKKAVNWALRNLGKRNKTLNAQAIETARQIAQIEARAAHWIAADALRELTGEKVQKRLNAAPKPGPRA